MSPRVLVLSLVLSLASPALAQEGPPLRAWIESALRNNPARGKSQSVQLAAEADRLKAGSALLPTVMARGTYLRNQYETVVELPSPSGALEEIVVSPKDSLEATISARVPLIDPPGLARWLSSRKRAQAAVALDHANENDIALLVARRYYLAVGSAQLVRAVTRAHSVAEENARILKVRVKEGATIPLEADRAEVEVARSEQNLLDARKLWASATRALASASGMPEPTVLSAPPPSLDAAPDEKATAELALSKRPEFFAAQERLRGARLANSAAWLAYAPSLSGIATQRWSNAPGFTGQANSWSAGLIAEWALLDLGARSADLKRERAAIQLAESEVEQTRIDVRDEVHTAWLDVETARAKVVASRRGEEVSRRAADAMRARFKAGTASQLDVIQSDRDALQAEVDRIRAEGELAVARLALRRATGEPVLD